MRRVVLPLALFAVLSTPLSVCAQSLSEQLDQEQFLRGLAEYGLHDLLDYVLDAGGRHDPAMPHIIAIAQLQAALADEALAPAQRARAVDELLSARRKLVEAFTSDPRAPLWRADLAQGILFLGEAQGAAALTAEFGVADEALYARLEAAAAEALRLIDDAMVGLADEILDLEEHRDFSTSAALQQHHRFLLHTEQRQRLPFLHACALHLAEVVARGDPREHRWQQVLDSLAPVIGELSEPWAGRARVLSGIALTRLGRYDEARRRFDQAIASGQSDALTTLRARLGLIDMLARSEGRPAAIAALDRLAAIDQVRRDPFAFLLVCDMRFRLASGGGDSASGRPDFLGVQGDAARRLVTEAVRVYRLYLQNDLLPLTASQREDVVADRWRAITPQSIPIADLPAEMALAQAERLTADAGRQDEAMALLEGLLARHGHSEELTPRLLLALGNLHALRGETDRACTMWLDAARRFPLDSRAPAAAERAAALLSAAVLEPGAAPAFDELYERALTLIIERFPQSAAFDRWAYERGLLLIRRARFDEAADSVALVAAGSPLHVDAAFQVVQARWKQAAAAPTPEEQRALLSQVRAAADRASDLADRARQGAPQEAARLADLLYYRVAAQVRAAQAQRGLGENEAALQRLERLEETPGVEDALAAEIVDARISVLEALGRTDRIENDLRELTQRSPQRALGFITRIVSARLAEAQHLSDSGDEAAAASMARERIEPLSRLGHSIAQPLSASGENGLAATLAHADALRLAGEHLSALAAYEQVLVWRETSAEAVLGRSECLFHLDRWADALPGYQRLADASAAAHSATFWLAELRILQVFDRAQRNTDRIHPRIGRLRLIDPQLGGPRFRPRFAVLEDRYAP